MSAIDQALAERGTSVVPRGPVAAKDVLLISIDSPRAGIGGLMGWLDTGERPTVIVAALTGASSPRHARVRSPVCQQVKHVPQTVFNKADRHGLRAFVDQLLAPEMVA